MIKSGQFFTKSLLILWREYLCILTVPPAAEDATVLFIVTSTLPFKQIFVPNRPEFLNKFCAESQLYYKYL